MSPFRKIAVVALASGLVGSGVVPALAQDTQPQQQQGDDKKGVEPVDFRKLKEALPEKLAGVARAKTSGQKSKFGEVAVSMAEGEYGANEGESPKYGKLTFVDYSDTEMAKGMASWLEIDIDAETEDDYTRTVTIHGVKALASYNKKEKRATLQMVVAARIMVSLELNGITDEEFKKAQQELPVKQLQELVKG